MVCKFETFPFYLASLFLSGRDPAWLVAECAALSAAATGVVERYVSQVKGIMALSLPVPPIAPVGLNYCCGVLKGVDCTAKMNKESASF